MRFEHAEKSSLRFGVLLLLFSGISFSIESSAHPGLFTRKLLGLPLDPSLSRSVSLSVDPHLLFTSQAARRALAWSIALELFSDTGNQYRFITPSWLSWTQSTEYSRLLFPLWNSLSAKEKLLRSPVDPKLIESVFRRDWENLSRESLWDEASFQSWKTETLADQESYLGSAGLGRNYFSPRLIQSYFRNYRSVAACTEHLLQGGTDPAPCFENANPLGVTAVKAIWRLESLGVPAFDTSAEGLERLFSASKEWRPSETLPGPASGALRVRRGDRVYALVGMHIMVKIPKDWFWITLWWSPDANLDFGEDRPAEWARRFPEWASYKLCAVSGFAENGINDIPSPHPGLRAALSKVESHFHGEQWCSNPYIEKGYGNSQTNCIGCHQHAGRSLTIGSEEVLSLPDFGRGKIDSPSPADALWTLTHDPAKLGIQTSQIIGEKLKNRVSPQAQSTRNQ